MEVKVGQWFRTKKNTIEQVKEFVTEDNLWFTGDGMYTYKFEDVKVANTPQELVQEKDLIEIKGFIGLHYVYNYGNNEEYRIGNNIGMLKNIKDRVIKILTPNSNGGYDLQYSKEND